MRRPSENRQYGSGEYGGFGTKAAHKAWQPGGAADEEAAPERVPRRFRRLRLRRKRLHNRDTEPVPFVVGFVMIAASVPLVGVLPMVVVELIRMLFS